MKQILNIAAKIIGGFFALTFILIGMISVYGFWSYRSSSSQIELTISYEGVCKKPGFPIFVGLVNNSQKAVRWYQARLFAHNAGRSTNLTKNKSNISDDYIIPPTEGRGNCWKVPPLIEAVNPSTLDWTVKLVDVKFAK